MTDQPTQNMNAETKLFQLVRNWFKANPQTQIPLDAWERKLASYGLSENSRFAIKCDGRRIHLYTPGLIPALASLSLGLGRKHVGETIRHHGVSLREVEQTASFLVSGDDLPSIDQCIRNMGKAEIYRGMVSGMLTAPALYDALTVDEGRLIEQYPMEMIRADEPRFWPTTKLEAFCSGAHGVPPGDPLGPKQIDASKFTLDFVASEETTDTEIVQWIQRAGYLNLSPLIDNDQAGKFFHDTLLKAADGTDQNSVRIVAAINSVEDEGIRDSFSQVIMEALSNRPRNAPSGEIVAAKALPLLDPLKYAGVVNSPVLRLNLLEWNVSTEHVTSPFHVVDEERLFRDLQDEVMEIEPSALKYHHFLALRHFAKYWGHAQSAEGVDVDRFVSHVTRGFMAYTQQPRWGDAARTKQDRDLAQAKVEVFLKMASNATKPDYDILNDLDSASKRFLCLNGYDIRSFKGMSRYDKGQVLSDELGL